MMSTLRNRIETNLRERFARVGTEDGGQPASNQFDPVFENLEALIEIVSGIRDFSTEPYLARVREVICAECLADSKGHCVRRECQTCGLDRYFPLIVAVIEKELKNDPGL